LFIRARSNNQPLHIDDIASH